MECYSEFFGNLIPGGAGAVRVSSKWGSRLIRTSKAVLLNGTKLTKNMIILGYKVSNHAGRKAGRGKGATKELVEYVINNAKKIKA